MPSGGPCTCGQVYANNCAHYLSNWMIHLSSPPLMIERPLGTSSGGACPTGRPIRAKDFINQGGRRGIWSYLGYSKHNSPASGRDYFVYCEHRVTGQGHVYYGTKSECKWGTGSWEVFGESELLIYFEYWY